MASAPLIWSCPSGLASADPSLAGAGLSFWSACVHVPSKGRGCALMCVHVGMVLLTGTCASEPDCPSNQP